MKNEQDYETAVVIDDNSPTKQYRNDAGNLFGNNQLPDVANKVIDAFTTYNETKRDIIDSVEITNRCKIHLDAEVLVKSKALANERSRNDNDHKERMQDLDSVKKMVDDAIETNDKDKYKYMVDLLQAKFTAQINHGKSDINWDSNKNKLDF